MLVTDFVKGYDIAHKLYAASFLAGFLSVMNPTIREGADTANNEYPQKNTLSTKCG